MSLSPSDACKNSTLLIGDCLTRYDILRVSSNTHNVYSVIEQLDVPKALGQDSTHLAAAVCVLAAAAVFCCLLSAATNCLVAVRVATEYRK